MSQQGGIVLLVGLITTFFSLGRWGVKGVPRENESKLSPKKEAFGIWSLIFILTAFKCLNALANKNSNEEFLALVFLGISYICSAIWVYRFSNFDYAFASIAISIAALTALVGHFLEKTPETIVDWVSQSSSGLLAGWLCIASAISIDYAVIDSEFHETVPIVLTLLLSTLSIYTNKPLLTLPLVWASSFAKYNILLSLFTSVSLSIISFYNIFS